VLIQPYWQEFAPVSGTRSTGFVTLIELAGGDLWTIASMMTKTSYNRYRFPPVIIQQAIWLYARFTLSFRDIEDLLRMFFSTGMHLKLR
jgi:hypothetical protein